MLEILGMLSGGIGGVVTALLPEVMGYFKDKEKAKERSADREHELSIIKLQMEQAAQGHAQKMEAIELQGEVDLLKATTEATKPNTGVRWVDALNASVRPIVTYWWALLYAAAKGAGIVLVVMAAWGAGGQTVDMLREGIAVLWTPQDMAILFSILGFWFAARELRKRAKGL